MHREKKGFRQNTVREVRKTKQERCREKRRYCQRNWESKQRRYDKYSAYCKKSVNPLDQKKRADRECSSEVR